MPSAVMRATVSLGPPAGNGTIMTMLRLGNCCACTNATVSSNSATSAVSAVILYILFSLDYPLLLSSAARAVRFLLRRRRRKVGNAYADRIIHCIRYWRDGWHHRWLANALSLGADGIGVLDTD